ncbi:monofunctional biosynthetic peptidoglycan transglycosylase [Fibrivirga algicola]|uniref:monofunctional biosynthetic peptidoglycan transglycosylase n=1 Tax=Fibrivirga algicola TaxID=2950420 RepID=UPI0018DC1371|nr:monofunctional biosynthetic peptidoglycan transglycosylase [Fibrivirga algicola]
MQPIKGVNRLRTPPQPDTQPVTPMPPPNRSSSGRPASGSSARPAKAKRSASSRSTLGSAIRHNWLQVRTYVRQRPWLNTAYTLISRTILVLFLASVAWVVILKYVPVWFTPLTISRKLDTIGTDKSSKIYKTWRPYSEINREAALAVIASEDQQFPYHWGFDFDEIQDAIKENQTRKRPRGASTISQQVAKNVFLWTGRSYIRKGLEVYFTVMIELIWGKKRILEVYLNVAETGPMTFGVEAASQRFYGHSAYTLNRDEAARIAAVLPNPNQFSIKKPSSYIQRRTRQIARQMRALGGQKYIRNL